MSLLFQILAFSLVLWFCIDRVKSLWSSYSWGKYITLALSIALGEVFAFCFSLDFIYAMELYNEITITGKIFTGIILSAGASPIAELIEAIKGVSKKDTN